MGWINKEELIDTICKTCGHCTNEEKAICRKREPCCDEMECILKAKEINFDLETDTCAEYETDEPYTCIIIKNETAEHTIAHGNSPSIAACNALDKMDDDAHSKLLKCVSELKKSVQSTIENMSVEQRKVIEEIARKELMKESKEAVDHPAHYNDNIHGMETIEYIRSMLSPEEFRGFLKGNIIKYRDRADKKNGEEDIRKMKWYLGALQEELEG